MGDGTEEVRPATATTVEWSDATPGITALGRRVTSFERLETFPAPEGITFVSLTTEEVTAKCPVTGQPDFYTVTVAYEPHASPSGKALCVESKTVKLYFQQFREEGLFCEAFAARVARDFAEALLTKVSAQVIQTPRGGVAIQAIAEWNPFA